MSASFVGVDVSKSDLDLHVLDGVAERFENSAEGAKRLISRLSKQPIERIVLEASGGYERLLVSEFVAAGLPVVVVNPRQVRDYAKAIGRLAKTDQIDAEILAQLAQAVKPELRPLPDEVTQNLQAAVARRQQLITMRTMEQNRLHQATSRKVYFNVKRHLEFLDRQIEQLDKDLDELIRQCPAWQENVNLLKSVPGIGPQTARVLVADLPELGQCNRQQIATLVGVAPLNDDSGQKRGKRFIRGGRASVRCALYMATLSGLRCNPKLKAHYQHLRKAGKTGKVALVACMRKLLVTLNSMLRTRQPWQLKTT